MNRCGWILLLVGACIIGSSAVAHAAAPSQQSSVEDLINWAQARREAGNYRQAAQFQAMVYDALPPEQRQGDLGLAAFQRALIDFRRAVEQSPEDVGLLHSQAYLMDSFIEDRIAARNAGKRVTIPQDVKEERRQLQKKIDKLEAKRKEEEFWEEKNAAASNAEEPAEESPESSHDEPAEPVAEPTLEPHIVPPAEQPWWTPKRYRRAGYALLGTGLGSFAAGASLVAIGASQLYRLNEEFVETGSEPAERDRAATMIAAGSAASVVGLGLLWGSSWLLHRARCVCISSLSVGPRGASVTFSF